MMNIHYSTIDVHLAKSSLVYVIHIHMKHAMSCTYYMIKIFYYVYLLQISIIFFYILPCIIQHTLLCIPPLDIQNTLLFTRLHYPKLVLYMHVDASPLLPKILFYTFPRVAIDSSFITRELNGRV